MTQSTRNPVPDAQTGTSRSRPPRAFRADWPRNEIMFVHGLAVHSPDYLVQVAREFETWHWRCRMGFNVVAAVGAFVGFLRFCRLRWES